MTPADEPTAGRAPAARTPRPDDPGTRPTDPAAATQAGGAPSGAGPDEPGNDGTVRDWPSAAPDRADDRPDDRSPHEDVVGDGAAEVTGPGRRGGRPALLLLGLLALLAVAGTAWLAWQVRQEAQTATARTEAVAAARDAARLLLSYDHERLEQDLGAGLAVTTGGYREQYERTIRDEVTPVATRDDAVVTAEVVQAGVVSASPGRVTVVVYVDRTTTSTRAPGPEVQQSSVLMALREVDGDWRVERLEQL